MTDFFRLALKPSAKQGVHRNIEVVWLLRSLKPDFKTIADFRSGNPAAPRCSASSPCCAGTSIFSGANCWRLMARASRRSTTRTATLRRTRWKSSLRRWTSVWMNICGGSTRAKARKPRQTARAPKTLRLHNRNPAQNREKTSSGEVSLLNRSRFHTVCFTYECA